MSEQALLNDLAKMPSETIQKILETLGEKKKRLPFAKGDGVVIWENTAKLSGEKYYNVQVLGNKGVACFKPKPKEEPKQEEVKDVKIVEAKKWLKD